MRIEKIRVRTVGSDSMLFKWGLFREDVPDVDDDEDEENEENEEDEVKEEKVDEKNTITYNKDTGWTKEMYDLRKAIDDVLIAYFGTDIDKSFTTLEVADIGDEYGEKKYQNLNGVRRIRARIRFDTYETAKAKRMFGSCVRTPDTCKDMSGNDVSTYEYYGFDKAKALIERVLTQLGATSINYINRFDTAPYVDMIIPEEQYQLYKTKLPICVVSRK